ncbi:hypothetical protein ANANG_G00188560 [Anguilla anguilla]|uniref:Uncharacterized protein n=1 Tax=Anguilla anguilla TaxID=7936 RepID=A0A9D3M7S2_ANGAN|nr:hypothetical protein ANANG_G00188560 [Anguilla anguilla]
MISKGLVQWQMHNENGVTAWKNGFPELQVPNDTLPVDQVCHRVKGGLRFMQAALEIVRGQQEELNPMATDLDFSLGNVTESVRSHLLPLISAKACPEATAQATPATPPAPTTPTIWHTDKKKRWGHTVLKLSNTFLAWLAEWLNQRPLKNHL